MRNILLLKFLFLTAFLYAQTAKDVNILLQKTIDLNSLKSHYSEDELNGLTPIILINDENIPDNLIIFKFNKRVKLLTPEEIETLGKIYKGNLDSYFQLKIYKVEDSKAEVIGTFRKNNPLNIKVVFEKENGDWKVISSKVG
jgi:hypothetical protein